MPDVDYEKILYQLFQAVAFSSAAVFLLFGALKALVREFRDFKEWLRTGKP